MARLALLMAALLAFFLFTSATIVEHSFMVKNLTVSRLCHRQVITAVNGSVPGPTIRVHEGDTLVVHVFNKSPYNLTIHWHGIFQMLSGWADGPAFITQCPIQPGNKFTYRFKITGQEGTLWWHAHYLWLRATVHGALIIRPRAGRHYPFPKPYREKTILLGEWWSANVIDVLKEAYASGGAPNDSNAFMINGRPGDLYNCSSNRTYKLKVVQEKTYLLRIINAALNIQFFFKIANHTMKVVAADATYTEPYLTDVVVIAPGQTIDVLLTANQECGSYYMAAHPYISASNVSFDNTATTGKVIYSCTPTTTPIMPILPAFNDTPTAHKFYTSLTGLVDASFQNSVPQDVDECMFVTFGLGLVPCDADTNCSGPLGQRLAASMNNRSFEFPANSSMLEAFYNNVSGVYTTDFPDNPPLIFDYTNINNAFNTSIIMTTKSTSVKKIKYNSTVQVVLQNTALVGTENHPIHLHGFNFYVLAQGFGNYDSENDPTKFNLYNALQRNTIAVPVGGWAVIIFRANNPGVWLFHCHLDVHLPWGLSTAFIVENGGTESSTLPPPPADLPSCC